MTVCATFTFVGRTATSRHALCVGNAGCVVAFARRAVALVVVEGAILATGPTIIAVATRNAGAVVIARIMGPALVEEVNAAAVPTPAV